MPDPIATKRAKEPSAPKLNPASVSQSALPATETPDLRSNNFSSRMRRRTDLNAEKEDVTLMQRVAANDEDAVGELQRRFAPLIGHMARQSFPDKSQADDITSEVLTRLWRTAGRYDPNKGALVTWVMLLARRHIVDKLRRQKCRIQGSSLTVDQGVVTTDHPSTALQTGEEAQKVLTLVAALPELQRTVVLRAYLGGQTLKQIGEELDIPIGTVKSALSRALIRLRERAPSESGDNATPTIPHTPTQQPPLRIQLSRSRATVRVTLPDDSADLLDALRPAGNSVMAFRALKALHPKAEEYLNYKIARLDLLKGPRPAQERNILHHFATLCSCPELPPYTTAVELVIAGSDGTDLLKFPPPEHDRFFEIFHASIGILEARSADLLASRKNKQAERLRDKVDRQLGIYQTVIDLSRMQVPPAAVCHILKTDWQVEVSQNQVVQWYKGDSIPSALEKFCSSCPSPFIVPPEYSSDFAYLLGACTAQLSTDPSSSEIVLTHSSQEALERITAAARRVSPLECKIEEVKRALSARFTATLRAEGLRGAVYEETNHYTAVPGPCRDDENLRQAFLAGFTDALAQTADRSVEYRRAGAEELFLQVARLFQAEGIDALVRPNMPAAIVIQRPADIKRLQTLVKQFGGSESTELTAGRKKLRLAI